jgi:3-methyladenine DNA glycosylase Mpg
MLTQRLCSASFNQALFDLLNVDPTAYENAAFQSEFQKIATEMFHNYTFMINGHPHRFTEVEFYLNGGNHPDDFAHDDPIQKECGSFYFHKMNGKYKGGSFKGMDVTFAQDGVFGGILIRGIQKLDAPRVLVDGPSLVVDHILKTCGAENVPALVASMTSLAVCDQNNLIHIAPASKSGSRQVYSSARVGLTLKDFSRDRENYIVRFYRFFTHPKDIKKGKPLMVNALHVHGKPEHEIHLITGTPKNTVAKYVDLFREGKKKSANFFYSKDLSTEDLCLLHGFIYGSSS